MVEGSPGPVQQKQGNIQKEREKGQVDSRHGQGDRGVGLPHQDAEWMKSMRQCGIMVVSDGLYRPSTSCTLTCRLGRQERSWVS